MDIALYTGGRTSILGGKDFISEEIETRLIYQNPDLVYQRLLTFLQRRFNINTFSEIDKMIISLSGEMDVENNKIINSYLINDLTNGRSYHGFDFNVLFDKSIPPQNIYLVNDAFTATLGVKISNPELQLPAMILTLEVGVGVGFINEDGSVLAVEWGGDLIPWLNSTIYDSLGKFSIERILFNGSIDTYEVYSNNLITTIEYLSGKYAKNNNKGIQSVVILGDKVRYVNFAKLRESFVNLSLKMINDSKEKNNTILAGCFGYPDYLLKSNIKVVKIEYLINNQILHSFTTFEGFVEHYIYAGKIANPENQYKIFYSNDTIETIGIGNIGSVVELNKFKF